MSRQLQLNRQIVEKLRTDTGADNLVDLTKHGVGGVFRIERDTPEGREKRPFLGVSVFRSIPLIGSDATQVKKSRVFFHCVASNEIICEKIADRMEFLLHDETGEANTGFYDFSGPAIPGYVTSAADISNRMTRWKDRNDAEKDQDTDEWEVRVEADVIWVDQPCGA